jgi:hypothetical protein
MVVAFAQVLPPRWPLCRPSVWGGIPERPAFFWLTNFDPVGVQGRKLLKLQGCSTQIRLGL